MQQVRRKGTRHLLPKREWRNALSPMETSPALILVRPGLDLCHRPAASFLISHSPRFGYLSTATSQPEALSFHSEFDISSLDSPWLQWRR